MQRRSLLKGLAALPALPAAQRAAESRAWLGPHYWANPLQDWRPSEGRIECHVSGGDRNLFWLTRELSPQPGDFTMTVRTGRLDDAAAPGPGWTGFRFGMRGHFHDYRDTALRGIGVEAGLTTDGRLFVGTVEANSPRVPASSGAELRLEARGTSVTLHGAGASLTRQIPAEWLAGGVALVCHAGAPPSELPVMREPAAANSGKPPQTRTGNVRYWFRDWTLAGSKVIEHAQRAWGPILFVQYTLSRRVLKMTVQLAPVDAGQVELRANGKTIAKAEVEPLSATAVFRVANWDDRRDTPYSVVFDGQSYAGTIRRDPRDKPRLVVGALTCQGDFGFPHAAIAANLKHIRPDLLLFTGDQLYEANGGYGIERDPLDRARLDYLRKWYLFGWAWGDLTREIPCVCLADDHDVYHGNVWGAGGRKAEPPPDGTEAAARQQFGQDSGGYVMAARWVNLVYRTQSSHLPDPPDASPIDQGISVHHGHLLCGGVSFALLEDRKWKSAPKQMLPAARIRNGWPQAPGWNSARQGDVEGAQLLGERQEKFLRDWARDWNGAEMKAVVSATVFCNLATLPAEMTSDAGTAKIPVEPLGGYARNERLTQDHDSNAWPQTPRNRALRAMRSCLAVHIAGDQHLGSTVQYGIDRWNDASFAICTPAISNIFPRRWYPPNPGANRKPGAPTNSGEYLDGFGNRITVHAVANPQQFGISPKALNERAPGFGVVEFDKAARRITFTNWPRWADLTQGSAKPYAGWPVVIEQLDNGLSQSPWELRLPRSASGFLEVFAAGGAEPVLSWRPPRAVAAIPVWQEGRYEVRAGRQRYLLEAVRR